MNADSLALSTVEAIFVDMRGRGLLKWIFDPRGAENLIGHFDDGEELRGIELEVQGQIKAAWQVIVGNALTRFYGAAISENHQATGADLGWRCFHCDEVFADAHSAKLHFGMDQCSDPACKIKMGAEKSLLVALRKAENELADAWAAIHNESTEAAKAYYAQQSRHGDQLRAAEEMGYERGIADRSEECFELKQANKEIEAQALRDRKLRDQAQDDALMWRYSIAMGDHSPLLVKVWKQRGEAFARAAAAEKEAAQLKIDASNHAADAETVRRERDAAVMELGEHKSSYTLAHGIFQTETKRMKQALADLCKAYAACNGEDDPAYERAERLLQTISDWGVKPPTE